MGFFTRIVTRALLATCIPIVSLPAHAAECKVSGGVTPSMETLNAESEWLAKLRASARDRERIVGEPRAEDAAPAQPKATVAAARERVAPGLGSVPALGWRDVTYFDRGKTYKARAWGIISESDAIEADKRERAREAKLGPEKNPLILGVERGDEQAVRRLIAEGFNVRSVINRYGKAVAIVPWAVARWYGRPAQKEDKNRHRENLLRQQAEAGKFLAITRLLLEAGADPSLPEVSGPAEGKTALSRIAYGNLDNPDPDVAIEFAKLLLKHGAVLSDPTSGRWAPPLDTAAQRNNKKLVDFLLRHASPTQSQKNSALVTAVAYRQFRIAQLAIEAGADPNVTPDAYGKCCKNPIVDSLLVGTKDGIRPLLKTMIRHGLNPNITLRNDITPLITVIHDHDLMSELLTLGADPNTAPAGDTALHIATVIPRHVPGYPLEAYSPRIRARSVELLLRHGANPNPANSAGITPLMQTSNDDAPSIELLLAAGAKIDTDAGRAGLNKKKGLSVGPVTWALMEGNEALALALLRSRLTVEPADCGAIFYAARGGAERVLAEIIDRKAYARVSAKEDGATPLIIAASQGHDDIVRILLDRRLSRLDEATPLELTMIPTHGPPLPGLRGGYTALMAAAQGNHVAVVKELIKRGADINSKDLSGATALAYARHSDARDVVAMLLAAGAHE